jgi:hypothetical protein
MTAQRRAEQRRRVLRPVGPAVLELVESLTLDAEIVEICLSAKLAAVIAEIEARDVAAPNVPGVQPAHAACAATVSVERLTAERWNAQAWRAVGDGLVAPAEAQALTDQLAPRGAA